MAEVDIPAAPAKFDGEGGLVRRNSTGNFNTRPTTPKILPHYLRASTGSCHDFCKYGFGHVPEDAKQKNPFSERFALTQEKSQPYQARSVANSVPRKKKLVYPPKVSLDLKIQAPCKCEVIMEEVPKSTKRLSLSSNHASDLKLKPVKAKVISLTAPSRLSISYTELILPKALGVVQANSNNRRSSESKTIKDNGASKTSSKSAFVAQTLPMSPKASVKRSSSTQLSSFSAPRQLSRRLTKIIMPKVQAISSSIRNSEIEMIKKMGTSKTSSKNGVRLSPKSSPKVSPVNDQSRTNFVEPDVEVVPEKILYVVEPEAEKHTVGLAENDSLASNSPPSTEDKGLIYDQNEVQVENLNCNHDINNAMSLLSSESKDATNAEKGTCNTQSLPSILCSPKCMRSDQIDPSEQIVEQEQRPRRIRRVVSEDRISSLQKVKFGRGKGVNVQSKNNSPRKSKFKQGKVLENQNGKADNGGRRLRRLVSDVVSDKTKTGPVKNVVLRHQEVKGRMVSSWSYNNVIEETASKLVESRKSKVKALVGAFETVISLQDRKSSEVTCTD